MVVKMRKWSPWPPSSVAATRKFQVAVKPVRLEVLFEEDSGGDDEIMMQKLVAIKIKWKGEPRFFPLMTPFQTRPKKELSRNKIMEKGRRGIIQWDDDDQSFENTCCFSVVSNHNDPKFGAWEIAFNVLYGEKKDSLKAKMAVIGRVDSVNISEIAWKMDKSSSVEQKLPLTLQIDGFAREATLTVQFNFVEVRESQESANIARTKSVDVKRFSADENKENMKARRRSLSQEEVTSMDESDESSPFAQKTQSATKSKEQGWFSWKSRRFSFKRAKTKLDAADPQCSTSGSQTEDSATKTCLGTEYEDNNAEGVWEEKELVSRDGQVKLKASVFLASFDQRSDKAAGESACTALVAVISHWLHSNGGGTATASASMPNRFEFNNLIKQGSSEWRKLCEDASYVKDFPNKHFDLETVLRADIRPILISHKKSFVGFFGAEMFESLKGAMSFDDIWDQISSNSNNDELSEPRIYIVSWNDHFFVLKAETDAYYIIDTLGERLFENCRQAYLLRFDEKTLMQKHKKEKEKENENSEEDIKKKEQDQIICSGKECCREFMKRFLAAIPLKELEDEEKKGAVSNFSLHQRLQIEFNYSYLSSPVSSSTSSPFSSLITATSQSSPFSE